MVESVVQSPSLLDEIAASADNTVLRLSRSPRLRARHSVY
jgi:hypothetical protein